MYEVNGPVNGTTIEVQKKDGISEAVASEFREALLYLAKGKLTPDEAAEISKEVLPRVDFSNPAVAHKGIYALARKTLEHRNVIDSRW